MKKVKYDNREFMILDTGTKEIEYNSYNLKYSVYEIIENEIRRVIRSNSIDECMDKIVYLCENQESYTPYIKD